MSVEQLLQLTQLRLANLTSQQTSAETIGDIAQIERLLPEIAEVQSTIEKLKSLL